MSNGVQLSLAMEKLVARRTFPLHARTSVCRSLFGPVDHDELNREMDAKLREISDRDRRRWNFNFESDAPVESGQYEWEATPAEESPAFYRDATQNARSRVGASCPPTPVKVRPEPRRFQVDLPARCEERLVGASSGDAAPPSSAEVNQENRTDRVNAAAGTRSRRHGVVRRNKRPTADSASDTNNTRITDFFVKRKRMVETKSSESSFHHHSLSPVQEETTPRKRIR